MRGEVREELVLAEVAAIGRIGAILGPLQLGGVDDLVAQIELARDAERELAMSFGVAGAGGGDRERPGAEDARRR